MNFEVKTFTELSARELYEILKSRAEVFILEQGIHYVDPDDVDYDSLHIFAMVDGRVEAYLRAYRSNENDVKIGRVLTLTHGKGTGTELLNYAIKVLPEKMKFERIIMDAQKQAVPFYEKLGFKVTSGEYMEEGIPHVDMSMETDNG